MPADIGAGMETALPVPATDQDKDMAREDTGAQPSRGAMGGYEAYMKRTGKACLLD